MDYFFTEEQQMMGEVAREIAEKRIRPVAAEYDESGEFPWPIVEAIAEADLFRVFIPELLASPSITEEENQWLFIYRVHLHTTGL